MHSETMNEAVYGQKLSLFTLHAVWYAESKINKHTYNHLLEDTKEDSLHAWACFSHIIESEVVLINHLS